MGPLIAAADATSTCTDSRIGFETEGNENWPAWDRFITVDGKRAHYIGNICGTCAFLFERLGGATTTISPVELSSHFKSGITTLEENILRSVTAALPQGNYKAMLLSCVLDLIVPSQKGDYFFEEQIDLWGIDPFWGVPHYTKNEYYRTGRVVLPQGRGLFEFVIPMFPKRYLDASVITSYEKLLSENIVPTALAISVLDVKQPAVWNGNPDITEHWCLSHYLLDGHHKICAASRLKKPISLLSFLAVDKGVSSQEHVAGILQVLKNP